MKFGCLIAAVAIVAAAKADHCKHRYPKVQDIPHHVRLEHSRLSKRSMEHNMRIKVFYHPSVEQLDSTKRKIVKDMVSDL